MGVITYGFKSSAQCYQDSRPLCCYVYDDFVTTLPMDIFMHTILANDVFLCI